MTSTIRSDRPGAPSDPREHLKQVILPFWLAQELGGFFTCFDNQSRERVSTDKFTWSQGRFVWLLAQAAHLAEPGLLSVDTARLLEAARFGAAFLLDHAVRQDSTTRFVIGRRGGEPDGRARLARRSGAHSGAVASGSSGRDRAHCPVRDSGRARRVRAADDPGRHVAGICAGRRGRCGHGAGAAAGGGRGGGLAASAGRHVLGDAQPGSGLPDLSALGPRARYRGKLSGTGGARRRP